MGTSNGDLIQGITNNFPKDTLRNICSNLAGGYCVKAYVLKKGRGPVTGPSATAKPGDKITSRCESRKSCNFVPVLIDSDKLSDSTGKYDQTILVNGQVKSTISTGM
jgi:hypothetical protein